MKRIIGFIIMLLLIAAVKSCIRAEKTMTTDKTITVDKLVKLEGEPDEITPLIRDDDHLPPGIDPNSTEGKKMKKYQIYYYWSNGYVYVIDDKGRVVDVQNVKGMFNLPEEKGQKK